MVIWMIIFNNMKEKTGLDDFSAYGQAGGGCATLVDNLWLFMVFGSCTESILVTLCKLYFPVMKPSGLV